ncbi:histidine kinase [Streptomyces albireticuli]|uniref:Sensor histidine kinase n=1 Tax=Streptomyces albireticuli TaxID=1940 RepID=A0A2A2D3C4_9ACTN|nr:histidine kinase [Streptomyces albireticuli]MCD9141973.1 histidine kinase [Streptomyces albireticuli]MCD9163083.1 histidine kinase [Streptomyces albireticuli]MCD9190147.1 histidine kinase [Streptomyces albireticuli]PAU46034.1 sensor histidine kinase [Streptomyces albireticuli]
MNDRTTEAERHKPPGKFALLPCLFMLTGDVESLLRGELPRPWLGGAGLVAFVVLYVLTVFGGLDDRRRRSPVVLGCLGALAAVTYALSVGYGGDWLLCFPLLSLASGIVLRGRGRALGAVVIALASSAGIVAGFRGGVEESLIVSYGTVLSGLVTAAILTLFETVAQLRETREELARGAVERERLRFSRDLHDLLGHTMSVIVVKAEAVRRLAPRDLEAALGQAADIEAVGRQALTEIREAVTGYREGSLTTELDRARSLLDASGIEADVRQSGPPLPPQTAALLGWVVREGVTNVVRHSGAGRCVVEVRGETDRVRLEITDDGCGVGSGPAAGAGTGGSGLKGLTERLAAAGGALTTGPDGRRGFRLVAELPVDAESEEDRDT